MTSYNPNDLSHRYCGHCHVFWPEVMTKMELDVLAALGSKCPRCDQHHADVFHPAVTCGCKVHLPIVAYRKGSGVLVVQCFFCGKESLKIKVGEK